MTVHVPLRQRLHSICVRNIERRKWSKEGEEMEAVSKLGQVRRIRYISCCM